MPSSSYSASRSGRGINNDEEITPHAGIRNIAAQDGYDAGDGYMMPNPQLWPNAQSSTYGSASGSGRSDRARRRRAQFDNSNSYNNNGSDGMDDDDDADDDDEDDELESGRRHGGYRGGGGEPRTYHRRVVRTKYGPPLRTRSMDEGRRTSEGGRRGRYGSARAGDTFYGNSDDSDSNNSDSDRSRGRGRRSSSKLAMIRRPSMSGLRRKASDLGISQKVKDLLWDSDNERTGNTEIKKLGATFAGALAGGFAAQQAGKKYGRNHWMPAALGAVMGGFTAREAEKFYFKRKADKGEREEEDEDEWEGGDGYRQGRSRSHGR